MQPDDTVRIPLRARDGTVRAYTLVDASDAEWVNQWRWSLDGGLYACRNKRIDGQFRSIKLHRELFGLSRGDGLEVDHRDRNRLNNTRSNLRIVTRYEQMQNRPSHRGSTSQYRGVSWNTAARKWRAVLHVGGSSPHTRRQINLGFFASEAEAAAAAQAERLRVMAGALD